MPEECAILFSEVQCIQCHGCETACKSWRGVELGVKWRRVDNLWVGRYPHVKSASLSLACLHCVDAACVTACPADAIKKRPEDGVVLVDREACTGCQSCLEACPFQVPQFGKDGTMQKCDLCTNEPVLAGGVPPCVSTCPTKALRYGRITPLEKIVAVQSLRVRWPGDSALGKRMADSVPGLVVPVP